MQGALGIVAVPVPDAEGRVARGLDLGGQDAGAERVADAAGQVDAVAGRDRVALDVLERATGREGCGELVVRGAQADAAVHAGTWLAGDDDPGLGLQVRIGVLRGVRGVRMDLQGEVVRGVEVLDEQGERAVGGRGRDAEQRAPVRLAQCAQRHAGERAAVDGRLAVGDGVGQVGDLPRLSDRRAADATLAERGESRRAPGARLRNRREPQWWEQGLQRGVRHGRNQLRSPCR